VITIEDIAFHKPEDIKDAVLELEPFKDLWPTQLATHETWVKLKLSEMMKPASSTRLAGFHNRDLNDFSVFVAGSSGVCSSTVMSSFGCTQLKNDS
jgi:hypothetical protein